MGLFSKKTEAEKVEKQIKKDKLLLFKGLSLQPIGKIAKGKVFVLSLVPESKIINIHHDKIDITLPYNRIKSFKVENKTTLLKSGSTIARSLVGKAIYGSLRNYLQEEKLLQEMESTNLNKLSKTLLKTTFWIGNLTYLDKNSKEKELIFIEYGSSEIYVKKDKHPVTSQFEMRLNEIVSEYQEDIKEL